MSAPIAEGITTLDDLVGALVVRRKQLGLPQRAVDDLAGYADGYTGKIEAGMKGLGKDSIPCLLGALKCTLLLMPSAAKHRESYGRTTRCAHSPKKDRHAEMGAKGGRARARNLSKARLRSIARTAARSRWASAKFETAQ